MKRLSLFFILLLGMLAGRVMAAPNLVTELEKHSVDITARYTGDNILLFGAMSSAADVIVKVVSPVEKVSINRKEKIGPFWLTGHKHVIEGVPGVFYLLSTRPIDEMLSKEAQAKYGLNLPATLTDLKATPEAKHPDRMDDAILRIKQHTKHYVEDPSAVKVEGGRLFAATISLPAKLPLGKYRVETLLVKDGRVVATQDQSISVDEVHMEHWFSNMAENHSWLFGTLFTLFVLLLGLALGIALGKGGPKR
ncbi:MAG: TIGR02186 family protein [Gammaproteobacteria bacterium]